MSSVQERQACTTPMLTSLEVVNVHTGSHLRACLHGGRVPQLTGLGGLKHSPPLHASHLGEIVSRAAANHNKQDGGQQKRFGGKFIFLSLIPLMAVF